MMRHAFVLFLAALFVAPAMAQKLGPLEGGLTNGEKLLSGEVARKPEISGFDHRVYKPGDRLVIHGRNLDTLPANFSVLFGGLYAASPISRTATRIVVRVSWIHTTANAFVSLQSYRYVPVQQGYYSSLWSWSWTPYEWVKVIHATSPTPITVVNVSPMEAPSRVTATPVSNTEVQLTWNHRMAYAEEFVIEQWNGLNWTTLGSVVGRTWEPITSLTVSTYYKYRVRARNPIGDSPAIESNVVRTNGPQALIDLLASGSWVSDFFSSGGRPESSSFRFDVWGNFLYTDSDDTYSGRIVGVGGTPNRHLFDVSFDDPNITAIYRGDYVPITGYFIMQINAPDGRLLTLQFVNR